MGIPNDVWFAWMLFASQVPVYDSSFCNGSVVAFSVPKYSSQFSQSKVIIFS
jgi:hypothetical protein